MLQRLYLHNFKCFQNFEFKPKPKSSLLIGKNGTGKSSIADGLCVFQNIGRGVSRLKNLVDPQHFFAGKTDQPMRLSIEVLLRENLYCYELMLELPPKFKEIRVKEETLSLDGEIIFNRQEAQVSLQFSATKTEAHFSVDWHLLALPLIQTDSVDAPVHLFRNWLAQMVVLSPIPQRMQSDGSNDGTLLPSFDGHNLVDWLSRVLGLNPATYNAVERYLKEVMPDLDSIKWKDEGNEVKKLVIEFANDKGQLHLSFDQLSCGERCFFLCAVVIAANKAYGPLFCFWDEPDNYLSLSEIGQLIMRLRQVFETQGQLVITSHSEEAVRKFSGNNTWVIGRKSHLEPAQLRRLDELPVNGDLIENLILGQIDP